MRQLPKCESDLVHYLARSLHADGYRVRVEVSNMGQSADLVATKGRWVTMVEAKLSNWRRAFTQCRAHEQVADFICVAVGSVRIPEALIESAQQLGYGVIHFNRTKQQFDWVLRPRLNRQVWLPQRRHWSRAVKRIGLAHDY